MIPRPEPTEVNRLATEAIELRKDEGITLLEAIETVSNLAPVPATDKPLKIGNVKAYEHLLQEAVTDEVYKRKYHPTESDILTQLTDEELEVLSCDVTNEQGNRIADEPEIEEYNDGRDFDEPYATEPEDRIYGI